MFPEYNSLAWPQRPLLSPCWGELTFCETGSMTSDDSGTAIRLVTPAAVVTHTYLDDPGDPRDELRLERAVTMRRPL
jgi:hypothetical protein